MSRPLLPTLGVLLFTALIGCGGEGGTGLPIDTVGRAPAGSYATTLSGTDDAATPTIFNGSGTSAVADDGTITFSYNSVASGASSGTTARRLVAAISTLGIASGTLTVGSEAARAILGGSVLTKNSDGTYRLTIRTSVPSTATTETDAFTLTKTAASGARYAGSNSGSDDQGGTYTGAGTATLGSGNVIDLTYNSVRRLSGASTPQSHALTTTLLSDGTFSGSLVLDAGLGFSRAPVTGTWGLNGNVLTLALSYTNTRYTVNGRNPVTDETLTLARQ